MINFQAFLFEFSYNNIVIIFWMWGDFYKNSGPEWKITLYNEIS